MINRQIAADADSKGHAIVEKTRFKPPFPQRSVASNESSITFVDIGGGHPDDGAQPPTQFGAASQRLWRREAVNDRLAGQQGHFPRSSKSGSRLLGSVVLGQSPSESQHRGGRIDMIKKCDTIHA